jgi:hypothetical protein
MTESVKHRPKDGGTESEDHSPRPQASGSICDPRVVRLFAIIRQLEECADKIAESEFDDLLQGAIVACGFADEVEAMRATLDLLGDGLWLAD